MRPVQPAAINGRLTYRRKSRPIPAAVEYRSSGSAASALWQIRSSARGTRGLSWRTGTYSASRASRDVDARGPDVERAAGQQMIEEAPQAEDIGPGADQVGASCACSGLM